MAVYVKQGGLWYPVKEIYTKQGGTWKQASMYSRVSGTWQPTHYHVEITADTQNYDLFSALGSPTNPVTVSVHIHPGVVVGSASTATPAFDTGGSWAAGSRLYLMNEGTIVGAGGNGGKGGTGSSDCLSSVVYDGDDGGSAISLQVDAVIDNSNGYIYGGGGGGGGGGPLFSLAKVLTGGGGGGGAGSNGGVGGIASDPGGCVVACLGSDGGSGSLSGFGAGGSGCTSGAFTSGYGGDGGDFGADGSDGGATTNGKGLGGNAGDAVTAGTYSISFVAGFNSTRVKGDVKLTTQPSLGVLTLKGATPTEI